MNIHESNKITVSDIEIKVGNFEEPPSVYKRNAQIISNEFNGKKLTDEHSNELKSIDPDEIYIKNKVQEEDQFNTNKINKREIKDEYFDVSEFIAHEDIIIKTEDREGQSNSKECRTEVNLSLKPKPTITDHEDVESLRTSKNSRFNEKTTKEEYVVESKIIVQEELDIKDEDEKEDQFTTKECQTEVNLSLKRKPTITDREEEKSLCTSKNRKFNENTIKEEYLVESKIIVQEELDIKDEDEKEDQFTNKYLDPDYKDSRKTLTCKYCYAGLSTEVYKETHESRCHFRKEQQRWGGSAFECSYCKLLYTREVDKNKHQAVCRKKILKNYEASPRKRVVRRYYCDKSSNEPKQKSNLIDLPDKVNAPKYSCNHCSYETVDNSRLKMHLRMHNSFGMICILCQKSFKQKVNLDAHYISRHPDKSDKWGSTITNKINDCPKCLYKTVRVGDFKKHLATHETPTDETQFKCKICSYKSAKNSNFKKHLRVHVGQLPFVCTECNKRFSIKSQLNGHILSRHSENEELVSTVTSKVHRCEKCAYKTVQNAHFKRHLKTCL